MRTAALTTLTLSFAVAFAQVAAPSPPPAAPLTPASPAAPPAVSAPAPARPDTMSSPVAPSGGPSLDVAAFIVEASFRACGQSAGNDARLNEVADLMLQGFSMTQATQKVGYRAQRGKAETYVGTITETVLTDALMNKCSQRLGYSRYGIAFNGQRFVLTVAEPAHVDLTRRTEWTRQFLALTNEARRQGQRCADQLYASTEPVEWDDSLARAATLHAAQLAALNFRGHIVPGSGQGPADRVAMMNFGGRFTGETIAYDVLTPEEAVRALLASPSHCPILMNPDANVMGADVTNGTSTSTFTTYWVQVFGTR